MSKHRYDPRTYVQRQTANEQSREEALRHGDEWTQEDDEFLAEFWLAVPPSERDEADIASALSRTIEACRNRAHYVRYNARRTTTRKITTKVGNVETTETIVVKRGRPKWMDDEGLPEWYQ